MKEIGLYIHIPFCVRKCYYCDFCSYTDKLQEQNRYVNAIINEIKLQKNKENFVIKTIYIGGGTPSILNYNSIVKIVNEIKLNFNITEDLEFTIELNPGTVTKNKLLKYKELGINRISIGLQETNDELLKLIGRIHSYKDFEKTYTIARTIGFNNISIDLMIGLPNQKIRDIEQSLNKIIQKKPEHISVYSLILEEETKLQKMLQQGICTLPTEEIEREMYWKVKEILQKSGYNHYEISNFSKIGYESKHNTDCWNQEEYIGLGAAAHSYLNKIRYSNISNLEKYMVNIENDNLSKNIVIHEKQNIIENMNEYMILGLRMLDGINIKKFKEKFSINPKLQYKEKLNKLQQKGLIEVDSEQIKLSTKGIDFANIVWEEFV